MFPAIFSKITSLIDIKLMTHILIALLIQATAYLLTSNLWLGAAAGSWYFIGREYAQAEYRLIEHYYGGLRANLPALAPLKEARAWTRKSLLDFILPLVVTGIIALLFSLHNPWKTFWVKYLIW